MSQSSKMLSWGEFAAIQPEMARFGEERVRYKVMYLATVKSDGYPRVHPFTPFIGSGHLFAFMEPASPKGKDLQRTGKYSMHSLVTDMNGTNGEFQINGIAFLSQDPAIREIAVKAAPYRLNDRYIVFEFKIGSCLTNYYSDSGPNVKRWKLA
jgi:hypothetical protein